MENKKRQDLPPGLWVVATPIGNLADLSPRARQALEECSAILCEDTRQGAKLLSALGISGPALERFDAHTPESRFGAWIDRLRAGESLALITDAGTPAISDPGSRLVARAGAEGVRVTPLPGPAAVTTLLSAAGFDEPAFAFRGFFPRKPGERREELKRLADSGLSQVVVWYESPQRINEALSALAAEMPEARAVAAKELTKIHEKIFRGTASEVAREVLDETERQGERGEWCFAVEVSANLVEKSPDSSDWVKALHCLRDAGVSASGAAKQVSQHFGVARDEAYEKFLKISGKKFGQGD